MELSREDGSIDYLPKAVQDIIVRSEGKINSGTYPQKHCHMEKPGREGAL